MNLPLEEPEEASPQPALASSSSLPNKAVVVEGSLLPSEDYRAHQNLLKRVASAWDNQVDKI